MKNEKGVVHVGAVIAIVVILLATVAGAGYYVSQKNVPSVKVGQDGVSVKVNGLDVETGTNGSVNVNTGGLNADVNDDGVSVNMPGMNANVSDDEVSLNTGGTQMNVSDDNVSIGGQGTSSDADKVNTVLIFDASGSMAAQSGGDTRMAAAKEAMEEYVGSLDDNVHLSVLAYGHKGNNTQAGKAASCAGIEEIYYMGAVDEVVVTSKVNKLQPNGWTPITASLQKAASILNEKSAPGVKKHIVLLSDGEESCGLDPVAEAKKLQASGITVDVIGLDVSGLAKTQLNNISINGGGVFLSADGGNLDAVVSDMGVKLNTGNLNMNVTDDGVSITGDNGLDIQANDDGASIQMDGLDIQANDSGASVDIPSAAVSIPSF